MFLGCQIKASWAHIERKTHSTSHFLPIPCQFGVSLQGKNNLIEIRLCGIFTFEKKGFHLWIRYLLSYVTILGMLFYTILSKS